MEEARLWITCHVSGRFHDIAKSASFAAAILDLAEATPNVVIDEQTHNSNYDVTVVGDAKTILGLCERSHGCGLIGCIVDLKDSVPIELGRQFKEIGFEVHGWERDPSEE